MIVVFHFRPDFVKLVIKQIKLDKDYIFILIFFIIKNELLALK